MKRNVTFVLSKGSARLLEVDTNAQTWGELKAILKDKSIDTSNIIGIIESNRNQLEMDDALLPAVDSLVIHVFQHQMKSGSLPEAEDMSRNEIIAEIKSVFMQEHAKEFFANYPQMKTDTMRASLIEWRKKQAEPQPIPPTFTDDTTLKEVHQTIDKLSTLVDLLASQFPTKDLAGLIGKMKLESMLATNKKLLELIKPHYA